MTIKAWGAGSLSFTEITAEFTGGATPHSLSEYYSGGSYVQAGATGNPNGTSTTIPTAGTISYSNFFGAAKLVASLSPSTITLNATQNTAITATTAFTATGFVGAVTYSVSPALPAGLSLNTSTGVISGTPTTTQASTNYTITGTGATSGSATATFSLAIAAAAATLAPTSQTLSATVNTAITATTAFTASNFVGAITYSVSPALPTGLSLNTSTGVISGTATATQAATSYTITGTGATSGSATSTISITVAASTLTLNTAGLAALSGTLNDPNPSPSITIVVAEANSNLVDGGVGGTAGTASVPVTAGQVYVHMNSQNDVLVQPFNLVTAGDWQQVQWRTKRTAYTPAFVPGQNTYTYPTDGTQTPWMSMLTFFPNTLATLTGKDGSATFEIQFSTDGGVTAAYTANVTLTCATASAGATFTTTGLNGVFLAAESFGSGRTAGVTIIFKNNGSVVYNETEFPFGDQLNGTGVWLASGSASGVSIRATQTGTGTGDIGSAPAGSSISASTGWLSLANDVTLAGVDCGPSGTTAMLTQPYLIEFSNDGGTTTAASYTVEIGGEIYV